MEKRMLDIGDRLRRIRERAGFSQEQLAEEMDCSVITISRWENGHTSMRAKDIVKAAESLNVSADYLLGIRDEESGVRDMLTGLNEPNREILRSTLSAMTDAMKLQQKN